MKFYNMDDNSDPSPGNKGSHGDCDGKQAAHA